MPRFKELESTLNAIDRLKKPGRIVVIAFRNERPHGKANERPHGKANERPHGKANERPHGKAHKPACKQVSVDVVGPAGGEAPSPKTSIEASVSGETLTEALEAAAGDLDPRNPQNYKGRHILAEGTSPATLITRSEPGRDAMATLRDLRNTILTSMREAGDAGDYAKAAALRQKSVGVNLAIKALSQK